MQPGGIDFPVLSQQIRRDQQKQQQTSQLDPVMCGARARPFAKSVYHRICLTQIEIFRFIGIHFASDGGCELRIQACAQETTMAPGKAAIPAPHLPLPDHVRHFALVFLLGLLSLKLGFAQEGNQSSPKNAGCHVEAVFQRTIRLGGDSPLIRFHASLKNVAGHVVEWSMQSVSQYETSDPAAPSGFNHDFWTFTPANPSSGYLNRYHVRFGPAENPAVSVCEYGLFTVHYVKMASELRLYSTNY